MMDKHLLIIGAGSFSIEIEEMDRLLGYNDITFLDDNPDKALAHPVIGIMNDIGKFRTPYDNAIVAMGKDENRMCYHNLLEDAGYNIPVLIHPTAYVSPDAKLVPGCIVRTFAVVGRYLCAEVSTLIILLLCNLIVVW